VGKILIAEDKESMAKMLMQALEAAEYESVWAKDGREAIQQVRDERFDLIITDLKLPYKDGLAVLEAAREFCPRTPVILMTAYGTIETAVKAVKEGAYDFLTKPFDPDHLSNLLRNAAKQRQLSRENIGLKGTLEELTRPPEIIGVSSHIGHIKELIATVAGTSTTVMIRGESGTGKELVAQAIHAQSDRRFFPIVSVNCGALSETLLESELFGHEKGAFTGALYRRKGKLEIADGGTLFLDEIGTIDMKTQVDLLRAIEKKEFTRLGGNEDIHSDFRVICATNTNLEESVKKGLFREDLYYRLQVYTIHIEPLRRRPEDIPELISYFIQMYRIKMSKPVTGISSEAMQMLLKYPWPGNVRELENAIERAMVVSHGDQLGKADFLLNQTASQDMVSAGLSMEEVEKKHLISVLASSRWNISQAARILGIDRVTIYKKLKKF